MKALTLFALMAIAFSSTLALAKGGGSKEGNGGDAVVCFKTPQMRDYVSDVLHKNRESYNPIPVFEEEAVRLDVESVVAYDHYEYVRPLGYPPVSKTVITPSGDYRQTLDFLLERLASKSSYGRELKEFGKRYALENWRGVPGVPEIDDSGEFTYLPRTCLLVQVALRVKEQVYFDSYLFSRMSVLDQVTLTLHEWVYAFGLDRNVYLPNSEPVRLAVALIISKDEFEAITPEQLRQRLADVVRNARKLRYGAVDYLVNGQAMKVEAETLYPSGQIETGTIYGSLTLYGDMVAPCEKGCEVKFHKSAEPSLNPVDWINYDYSSVRKILLGNTQLWLAQGPSQFHPNGVPTKLLLAFRQRVTIGSDSYQAETLELHSNGSVAKFTPDNGHYNVGVSSNLSASHVEFWPNGRIKSIAPNSPFKVMTDAGEVLCADTFKYPLGNGEIHVSDPALFHANGKLEHCSLVRDAKVRVGRVVFTATAHGKSQTSVEYHSNGSAKRFLLKEKETRIKVGRRVVTVQGRDLYAFVTFYDFGGLNKADIADRLKVLWKDTELEVGGSVEWNRQGRIVRALLLKPAVIEGVVYKAGHIVKFGPEGVW